MFTVLTISQFFFKKEKKQPRLPYGQSLTPLIDPPKKLYIYGILGSKKIIAFVIQKFPNSAKFHQKKFGVIHGNTQKIHLLVVVAKGSFGQLGEGSEKK